MFAKLDLYSAEAQSIGLKCKGCQNRHVGCHGDCETYKKFQKQIEVEKKQRESVMAKRRLSYNYSTSAKRR